MLHNPAHIGREARRAARGRLRVGSAGRRRPEQHRRRLRRACGAAFAALTAIATFGWSLIVTPPFHTLVLVWKAIVTMLILDELNRIGARDRSVGVVLIVGVWILIARLLWR
jgi:hypothetical protein